MRVSFFAGDKGFEPLLAEPESAVLPLDESPKIQRGLNFSMAIIFGQCDEDYLQYP